MIKKEQKEEQQHNLKIKTIRELRSCPPDADCVTSLLTELHREPQKNLNPKLLELHIVCHFIQSFF